MEEFHFTLFQKVLMGAFLIFLILMFIVRLFLKSIGEPVNKDYLRGNYTKEDLARWESKINSKYSGFLFEIVKRIRNFGIIMAIVFFVIPLVISIIMLLLGYDPMSLFVK